MNTKRVKWSLQPAILVSIMDPAQEHKDCVFTEQEVDKIWDDIISLS